MLPSFMAPPLSSAFGFTATGTGTIGAAPPTAAPPPLAAPAPPAAPAVLLPAFMVAGAEAARQPDAPPMSKRGYAEIDGSAQSGRRTGPRYSIFASFTDSLPFCAGAPSVAGSGAAAAEPAAAGAAATAALQPTAPPAPPPSPPTSPPWSMGLLPRPAGGTADTHEDLGWGFASSMSLQHPVALLSGVTISYFLAASAFDLYATPWFKVGAVLQVIAVAIMLLRLNMRLTVHLGAGLMVVCAVVVLGRAVALPDKEISDGLLQTERGAQGLAAFSLCAGALFGLQPASYLPKLSKLRIMKLMSSLRACGLLLMLVRTSQLRSLAVIVLCSDVPFITSMLGAMRWAEGGEA